MKEIVIDHFGTNYHLLFREVYPGESLSRYEISAGEKIILLERRHGEKRFEKRWKVLSVNWQIQDKKAAARFLNEIMIQIDQDLDPKHPSIRQKPD